MSTTRKILNQICLHHLPISNLYPDPFHHVFFQHVIILITLSTTMAILNQIDQFITIPFSKLPIKRSTPSSAKLKFIPLCNSPPLLSASDHFLDAFFFFSLFLLQVPIKRSTRSSPLLPFLFKIAIASIHPTLWPLSSLVCLRPFSIYVISTSRKV